MWQWQRHRLCEVFYAVKKKKTGVCGADQPLKNHLSCQPPTDKPFQPHNLDEYLLLSAIFLQSQAVTKHQTALNNHRRRAVGRLYLAAVAAAKGNHRQAKRFHSAAKRLWHEFCSTLGSNGAVTSSWQRWLVNLNVIVTGSSPHHFLQTLCFHYPKRWGINVAG